MTTINTALLVAIATRIPGITLANALGLVEDVERYYTASNLPDVSTHAGLTAYARTLPDVMSNLPDRKIQAIKALRTAGQAVGGRVVGLKESKDAIDAIVQTDYAGRLGAGRY